MRMKHNLLKRVISFLLVLILSLSPLISQQTVVNAASGSTTIRLSVGMYGFSIPSLGYSSSDNMWDIYDSSNSLLYCISPHKHANTGCRYSWQSYNAVTFYNQSYAKCLTYYHRYIGYSTLNKAQTQAYLWAISMGRSKTQAVYEAGRSVTRSYTWAKAESFCNAVSNTNPEGTIYVYNCTSCPVGRPISAHQTLLGYSSTPYTYPSYQEVYYENSDSTRVDMKVNIDKTDAEDGTPVDGAKFEIYCDDKYITTVTTQNGQASTDVWYQYGTSTWYATRWYITNWNQLSVRQQQQASASGYYDSQSKAYQAAKSVVDSKVSEELKSLLSQNHTWTAKEVEAPYGYYILTEEKSINANGNTKDMNFSFTNAPQKGSIIVNKWNGEVGNTDIASSEASLVGAEYSVKASGDIYKGDTKLYSNGEEVGRIVIDDTLTGRLDNLPLGRYVVEEVVAPPGFELDLTPHMVNLSSEENAKVIEAEVDSCDEEFEGFLEINKTLEGRDPEQGAEFEIRNSENEVVQTLVTDSNGYAKSDGLPYGTYKVVQTVTADGYMAANDFLITIDESTNGTTITKDLADEKIRDYAWLKIVKTYKQQDAESNVNVEALEEDATFQILDSNDDVVETLTTDEYGYAESGALDPGTYTVTQTDGKENYAFVDDFSFTVHEGEKECFEYDLINTFDGSKVRVEKTMSKDGETTPEANAEFTIFDIESLKDLNTAGTSFGSYPYDVSSRAKLVEFTTYLDDHDLALGSIKTNSEGTGADLIDEIGFDEGQNFAIVQTDGADGYALSGIVESSSIDATTENGMSVYTFELDNPFDEYAFVEVQKEKTVTDTGNAPEEGAEFEILNVTNGEVVETLTTNEDGYAMSQSLEYGSYILHQTVTALGHGSIEDQAFTIDAENQHETITFDLLNEEIPVEVLITKTDATSGTLLPGAEYLIMDSNDEIVTTMVTGQSGEMLGKTNTYLDYGTYTLIETKAPDGYVRNEEELVFTLSDDTVDVDKDGTPKTYYIDLENEPIYGTLILNKSGELLTGYSEDQDDKGFVWENSPIDGAVYGLYAEEDIISADGKTVHYQAGDLVSKATTNEEGQIIFTQMMNGRETNQLYLGDYYVQELVAPVGFTLDPEKHSIRLTWDKTAEDVNDVNDPTTIPDVEDPAEGDVSTEAELKTYEIGLNNASDVIVTITKDGLMTVSGTGTPRTFTSQSNVPWYADGTYLKVKNVVFETSVTPTNLNYWFKDCSSLKSVSMNLENSNISSMVSTFENCVALEQAPSLRNASRLINMNSTFKNCTSLQQAPEMTGCTAITNLNNTFENCVSMSTVPNLSGSTQISSMQSAFKNCVNMNGTLAFNVSTNLASTSFTNALQDVSKGTAELTLTGLKWQNLDPIYESKSSNSNVVYESTRSTLIPGPEFSKKLINLIGSSTANGVYFVDTAIPTSGTKIDVSVDGSGSAIMYKSGSNIYITSGKTGCKLKANKDASLMFSGAYVDYGGYGMYDGINAKILDVSNLDTKNTTNMSRMFQNWGAGTDINVMGQGEIRGLENLNTENVTDMSYMFKLVTLKHGTELNLSNFNTKNVENMQEMFRGTVMTSVKSNGGYDVFAVPIDFSGFDMRKVTNAVAMFAETNVTGTITIRTNNLNKTISYPATDDPENPYMQTGSAYDNLLLMANLSNSDAHLIMNYDSSNLALVRNIMQTRQEGGYEKGKVTLGTLQPDLSDEEIPEEPSEIVGTWNVGSPTASSVTATLHRDGLLEIEGRGDVQTYSYAEDLPWEDYRENIKEVTFDANVLPTNLAHWFEGCYALQSVDLSRDSLENLENLAMTFSDCYNLRTVPDFSAATHLGNMNYAFENCYNLQSVSLGNLSELVYAEGAFQNCYNLMEIPDFSQANSVSNISGMFFNTYRLDGIFTLNVDPPQTNSAFRNAAYGESQVYLHGSSSILENLASGAGSNSHVYVYKVTDIQVIPEREKVEADSELTVEDFTYVATYTDYTVQEITLDPSDVTIAPSTVPSTSGPFDVSFDFIGSYGDVPSETVRLTAINLADYDFSVDDVKEVVEEINLTDTAQKVKLRINKTDDRGEILPGAVFQLKTLVDILDKNGNVIVKANTVLDEKVSDEFGAVDFGAMFPTEIYTSGDPSQMYQIVEVQAPTGYQKSNQVLTFSGEIPDTSTPLISHEATVENEELDEIVIKKEWNDSNNVDNLRPSSIQIEVLKNGSVMRTVTLNNANDWEVTISDLPKNENGQPIQYTFREKSVPAGYTSSYTFVNGVCTFVNTHEVTYIDLSVNKVWDDESNADGLRPSSVKVNLYANDELNRTITLNASNSWKTTVENLRKTDSNGDEIQYEFVEVQEGIINGNYNTGYSASYATSGNTTTITNKHVPQLINLTVEKVWDDNQNEANLRPSTIAVALMKDGRQIDQVELTAADNWSSKTIHDLPKYEDGREIQYEFRELTDGVLIGVDPEIGYEVSYKVSGNKTTITNTHTPKKALGSIVITKRIKADDINFANGDPTFIFHVTGTLEDNSTIEYNGLVSFTEEYVRTHTDSNGYVSIACDFLGLEYGNYVVSEEIVARYEFESITDVENGTIIGDTVSIPIDRQHESGAATFTNEKGEWGDYSDTAHVINHFSNGES